MAAATRSRISAQIFLARYLALLCSLAPQARKARRQHTVGLEFDIPALIHEDRRSSIPRR